MPDALHADALATLTAWDPPDTEQAGLRDWFVAHLRHHEDGCRRSCFPAHLTAGTLVVSPDGAQVLLNLHRKAGRWFAFGGHSEDPDTTLAGVALREAHEESGIDGLGPVLGPVQLNAHQVDFCDPRGPVTHLDVRYAAVAGPAPGAAASAESLAVQWWPVDALPATLEDDMRALVRAAVARVRTTTTGRATSPPGTPAPSRPAGSGPPTPRTSRRDRAR